MELFVGDFNRFWKRVVLKDFYHIFLRSPVGTVVFACNYFVVLACIRDFIHEFFAVPNLSWWDAGCMVVWEGFSK